MVLGLLFIIVGYVLYVRLKKFSFVIAKVMKWRIVLMTVLISGPIIIRGIYNLFDVMLKFHFAFMKNSAKNGDFSFPVFIVLFTTLLDFLPMGFLYLSIRIVVKGYGQRLMNSGLIISNISESKEYNQKELLYEADESEHTIDNA